MNQARAAGAQALCVPETHAYRELASNGRQHCAPVQYAPGRSAHAPSVPRTHSATSATQHVEPVHQPCGGVQLRESPSVHMVTSFTQHRRDSTSHRSPLA